MFLAIPDPGSWKTRCAQIRGAVGTLFKRGQIANGLPTYRLAENSTTLLIPFRPSPKSGHRPFVRHPGEAVLHVPTHPAAVVAPPPGTWKEVIAAGRETLKRFLDENKLEPAGDLICIPFLPPQRVPEDAQLRRLQVRLEQPVAERSGR